MARPTKKQVLQKKRATYARTWRAQQAEKGKTMLQMWVPEEIVPAAKAAVLRLVNAHNGNQ